MSQEVTPREALMRLGATTAEAVAQVLEAFVPGDVDRGDVTVVPDGASPFSSVVPGAVSTSVSFLDGASGASIFVITPPGARALAAAMGVPASAPAAGETEELAEAEVSAVAEAANQAMAAAASAISVLIGQEIQISEPDTRVLSGAGAAVEAYGRAAHATSTTFMIGTEACRLIQLVPAAFVMRMVRAIDDLKMRDAARRGLGRGGGDDDGAPNTVGIQDALAEINLRVWAELGRTRLPLAHALELPPGALIDLDRAADDPVDLYVNGLCFAQGHLVVSDDGEWSIVIDRLGAPKRGSGAQIPAAAAPGSPA